MIGITFSQMGFIHVGHVLSKPSICHLMRNELTFHHYRTQFARMWRDEKQARFAIIKNPCRYWSMEVIQNIMFACCILHNMILEDEEGVEGLEDIIAELEVNAEPLQMGLTFQELLAGICEIEDSDTYYSLKGDLIEHLWSLKSANLA